MVSFEQTAGGYKVYVGGKQFGWLSKEHGYFTDPTVVKESITVSAADLRKIADKSDEVKARGYV